jgi:hypothetical protein
MRNIPTLGDKLICASLYTGLFIPVLSWVPILWIIIANLRKSYMKDFNKYHCYQAVLFNMIAFALPKIFELLVEFLANLLSITVIFENTASILIGSANWIIPYYYVLIKIIAIYAIIWTIRGRYTEISFISQAVNQLLR